MSSGGFDYSGLGGAVKSVFGGAGDLLQAGAYNQAGDLATKNAEIEKRSTAIKMAQAARQGFQVIGATEAAAGANNLSMSGSAMDVLRSNIQQVSLQKTLTENQGLIEQHSWEEKAASDYGAAQAAQAAGAGGILGGLIQGAGILATLSDARLKDIIGEDGVHVPGINFYRFRFKGSERVLRGVLAQEVQMVRPDAVSQHPSGYLMVNYEMLGLAEMTDA